MIDYDYERLRQLVAENTDGGPGDAVAIRVSELEDLLDYEQVAEDHGYKLVPADQWVDEAAFAKMKGQAMCYRRMMGAPGVNLIKHVPDSTTLHFYSVVTCSCGWQSRARTSVGAVEEEWVTHFEEVQL